MSKATPGPWRHMESEDGFTEYDYSILDHRGVLGAAFGAVDANEANARLMAAAPDLLEALKDVETILNRIDWDLTCASAKEADTLRDQVEAAIAKAEGNE